MTTNETMSCQKNITKKVILVAAGFTIAIKGKPKTVFEDVK